MAPWTEWQERCAVALCTEETQGVLRSFGGMRFRSLAQRCLPMLNVSDIQTVMLSDTDAWHLLETHMTVPRSANGKAYKQWLFARTERSQDAPFDVVQGGATLLMRAAVREHLRKEYSPTGHVSTDHPINPDAAGSNVGEEWLSADIDTRDVVALRELKAIASRRTDERFDELDTRARLALAARHLHVPLSSPPLLALAACGKSTMSEAYSKQASDLLAATRASYPDEDKVTVTELALLTFEALADRCVQWVLREEEYREVLLTNAPLKLDAGRTP